VWASEQLSADPLGIAGVLAGVAGILTAIYGLVNSISRIRRGVSARETTRQHDLVEERNAAEIRADDEWKQRQLAEAQAFAHAENERLALEYASQLRRLWIEHGPASPALPSAPALVPIPRSYSDLDPWTQRRFR
jgi:hypothetical protein